MLERDVVQPKLINMALNGDPKTQIGFAWYTDATTRTVVEVVEASLVQDGIFPAQSARSYVGSVEQVDTYVSKEDRASNTFSTFYSHKAVAEGLEPGTTYRFRVGNGEPDGWSEIGSFTTAPAQHENFRFIFGSDSQTSRKGVFELWADTFKKALEHVENPKFFLNGGDFVDHGDLEEQWQWLLDTAKEQLMHLPMIPVLGGHEVREWSGDTTTENRNFYFHFNTPKQVLEDTHEGSVYSFEYGNALFVVANTQFNGQLDDDGNLKWVHPIFHKQVEWMRHVVAKTDKKWKVLAIHRTPYAAGDNTGKWEPGLVPFYRKYLVPVIDELGFDAVFHGHEHMYMRTYQMLGDRPLTDVSFDEDGAALNPGGSIYLMPNTLTEKYYMKYPGYDDYFSVINEQPFKKMFIEVSVEEEKLELTAYTASVDDEGKPGTVGNGLHVYDRYAIRRTDEKPAPPEHVAVTHTADRQTMISWSMPSHSQGPIRGFRVYEKSDKVQTHWSAYVPAVEGQTEYMLPVDNIDPSEKYDFIIKSVGRRRNSDPVEL